MILIYIIQNDVCLIDSVARGSRNALDLMIRRLRIPSRGYPEKLPKPNRLDFTGFGADSQTEPVYVKYADACMF